MTSGVRIIAFGATATDLEWLKMGFDVGLYHSPQCEHRWSQATTAIAATRRGTPVFGCGSVICPTRSVFGDSFGIVDASVAIITLAALAAPPVRVRFDLGRADRPRPR